MALGRFRRPRRRAQARRHPPAAAPSAGRDRGRDRPADARRRQAAAAGHAEATQAVRNAASALAEARRGPAAAEQALGVAREEVERHGREAARRDARIQSLDQTIAHFDAERIEAEQALAAVEAEALALEGPSDLGPRLAEARTVSGAARETAAAARAALDVETREQAGRTTRLAALTDDHANWTRRSSTASSRIEALTGERAKAAAALDVAREAPAALEERRAAPAGRAFRRPGASGQGRRRPGRGRGGAHRRRPGRPRRRRPGRRGARAPRRGRRPPRRRAGPAGRGRIATSAKPCGSSPRRSAGDWSTTACSPSWIPRASSGGWRCWSATATRSGRSICAPRKRPRSTRRG